MDEPIVRQRKSRGFSTKLAACGSTVNAGKSPPIFMWKPSRQFKAAVVTYGWLIISLFVLAMLGWQFRVLWLVPLILIAVALLKLAQRFGK